jgi:hypothetical protein
MAWDAQEKCYRDGCRRKKLEAGEVVCQVALGQHWSPYETPTRGGVVGEWHEACFEESFPALYQSEPNGAACFSCARPIDNLEEVVYGVRGLKPRPPFVRPEERGHSVLFVLCQKCMFTRDFGRISYWYRHKYSDRVAMSFLRFTSRG